jgi:hypothetical protein
MHRDLFADKNPVQAGFLSDVVMLHVAQVSPRNKVADL